MGLGACLSALGRPAPPEQRKGRHRDHNWSWCAMITPWQGQTEPER